VVGLLWSPVNAEVFLNRQWDDEREEWYTGTLLLEGEGLSIDRSYQNAYGLYNDLPPGPPFYIEAPIHVRHLFDEDWYVEDWGSFSINTNGEGGTDNFDVIFLSNDEHSGSISTCGRLSFVGSLSDPIIFKGDLSFSSIWNFSSWESEPYDKLNITFRHCWFQDPIQDQNGASPLLFRCGHITLDTCLFEGFGTDYIRLLKFEDINYDHADPNWDFVMRGCTVRDNYIQDRWLMELWYLRNLIIEGNRFFDNIFEPAENTAGLIGYRGVGIGSIRDNTGSGNTADCIQIVPVFSIEVSIPHAHIETSEEMPLISRFLHVSDSSTLEIHPGSVLKMVPGTYPGFEVDGVLIADSAVFTSYEDDSHGGDTDLKPPGPDGIDSWGFNEGISIRTSGSVTLKHSTVQYAHGVGLRSHGQTHVDSSLFQYNRGSGIGCVGYGFGTHRITNSVFHQNEGSGVSFSSQDGL
jgi:hypothetical protein